MTLILEQMTTQIFCFALAPFDLTPPSTVVDSAPKDRILLDHDYYYFGITELTENVGIDEKNGTGPSIAKIFFPSALVSCQLLRASNCRSSHEKHASAFRVVSAEVHTVVTTGLAVHFFVFFLFDNFVSAPVEPWNIVIHASRSVKLKL